MITSDDDTNLVEAARLMRHNHVGSIIVTRQDGKGIRPVGIITDRDLAVEILAEEIDPQRVTLEDIMTRNPLMAYEDDDAYEVLDAMRSKGVRRIPVIDREGLLIGVLAIDDILRMIFHELGNLVALIQKEYETELRLRKAI